MTLICIAAIAPIRAGAMPESAHDAVIVLNNLFDETVTFVIE